MAGEWIKWTKGLARKPEVLRIAAQLGMSRHAAAGLLMEVWEWADDNVTIDESVSGSQPDTCPGSVRLGEQSLQLFDATFGVSGLADAMTAVGWIVIRSGSLTFPNFARHNGKSAKARALDSLRKRNSRGADSGTCPDPVSNVSGSEPDKKRTREEERRGEKKKEKEPPNPLQGEKVSQEESKPKPAGEKQKPKPSPDMGETVPIPPQLDTPAFRELWATWLADRRKRKKPMTAEAAKMQFAKLVPRGVQIAIQAIQDAIAGGWSGVFPEKYDKKPPPTLPPPPRRVYDVID